MMLIQGVLIFLLFHLGATTTFATNPPLSNKAAFLQNIFHQTTACPCNCPLSKSRAGAECRPFSKRICQRYTCFNGYSCCNTVSSLPRRASPAKAARIATGICVGFFVRSRFSCATATSAVTTTTFILSITLPNGCSPPMGVYQGAYAALKAQRRFGTHFQDDPDLVVTERLAVLRLPLKLTPTPMPTLSPSQSRIVNARIATQTCVRFFVRKGFSCATASPAVTRRLFTLSITLPAGCNATQSVFTGAYRALRRSVNFADVFVDEPDLTYVQTGTSTLKLPFVVPPTPSPSMTPLPTLNSSLALQEIGAIAMKICVCFFNANGFGCATARFTINGSVFCLFITTPRGCNPPLEIFQAAYQSLRNSPNFSSIFLDEPDLDYVPGGTSKLTLPLVPSPSPSPIMEAVPVLTPELTQQQNGAIAMKICVCFFNSKGFRCASARFTINRGQFCLFINTPRGCNPPIEIFRAAYQALKNSPNFGRIFVDKPNLEYVPGGTSKLTLPFLRTIILG